MAKISLRHARIGLVAATVLGFALLGLLTWQQIFYRGWFFPLGEWQFGEIDRFFPLVTILFLALIVSVPALLIAAAVFLWRRRHTARAQAIVSSSEEEYRFWRARRGAVRMARLMIFIITLAVVGLVLVFVLLFQLPDDNAPPVNVDTAHTAVVRDGPARLIGSFDTRRVALFSRRILLLRRDLFVVPVIPPRGQPIRYFVEVSNFADRSLPRAPEGILIRGGMPGPLLVLYRDHRAPVADQPALLFASRESLDWPYAITAFQLLILIVGCSVFLGLFRWRIRGIETRMRALEAERLRLSAH